MRAAVIDSLVPPRTYSSPPSPGERACRPAHGKCARAVVRPRKAQSRGLMLALLAILTAGWGTAGALMPLLQRRRMIEAHSSSATRYRRQ
jgi:hypothetical protein